MENLFVPIPPFGVSWGLLGYSQHEQLALIQIVDVTGVYGLSFLMAFSSYVLAECDLAIGYKCQRFRETTAITSEHTFPWSALCVGVASIAVVWGYGLSRLESLHTTSAPTLTITTVQSDIPGEQMWKRSHYARNLARYAQTTHDEFGENGARRPASDLVIWPEFALHFSLNKEIALHAQLSRFVQRLGVPLLVGAPRVETGPSENQFYNSAYLLAANGKLDTVYDKIRLVPFAEYQPFSLPTLFAHTPDTPSTFTPGQASTIFRLPTSLFGTTICYEATYASFTRNLVRNGAQFLVNIFKRHLAGKESGRHAATFFHGDFPGG